MTVTMVLRSSWPLVWSRLLLETLLGAVCLNIRSQKLRSQKRDPSLCLFLVSPPIVSRRVASLGPTSRHVASHRVVFEAKRRPEKKKLISVPLRCRVALLIKLYQE